MSKRLMSDYENFLKRMRNEGWRDPIQITNLEILAYQAGMTTERKRVLAIFKDVEGQEIMRFFDLQKYLNKIKKPNNPV